METFIFSIQNWLANLLFKRTMLCLVILFCIGIGIVLADMSSLSRSLIESQALSSSEAQANSLINAWKLYSQAVAIRLQKNKDVTIRHDYFLKENSIPPPATFTIQLGSNITEKQEDLSIRLYSAYPWPWRKAEGGPKTPFEKEALAHFKEYPEDHKFYRIENTNNRYIWRYAQAVIMETSCVACHNTSPQSPKKDWNVGDVRGAIEITQSLDGLRLKAQQSLRDTFAMLGSVSVLTISGLTLVMSRLNQSTQELEKRVKERTATLAEANQDLEQRNILIRQVFGRYMSDELVEKLLDNPQSLNMGGERRSVTVLASDLRGFTAISESFSAEEVITILNIYLEKMADIIDGFKGTIIEIMGDGLLVLFGVPTEETDDAPRAIACAVTMQLAMTQINQKLKKLGFPQLEMGIGINTGLVILGNIGSQKHTKYGVVGREVNFTYRIESYSTGGEILLSESTFNECRSIVIVQEQMNVQAKGIKEEIVLHKLEGIRGSYNLFLPPHEETFLSLSEPLPIQYQILAGKHLNQVVFSGQLTELSKQGAKVIIDPLAQGSIPQKLTNLKLNLCPLQEISNDIYAKVSEQESQQGSFYIHFTSKIPILDEIIEETFSH